MNELVKREQTELRLVKKFNCLLGEFVYQNAKVYLMFPQTYMNNSGRAVAEFVNFYKITMPEVLVAHDEIDFACGKARLKYGGGAAGHNGLRSIISCSGQQDFWRLRIGIDRPAHKNKVLDYVLSVAKEQQQQQINQSIVAALSVIDLGLSGDWQRAQNQLAQRISANLSTNQNT